jgi:hypothetical protein
MTKDQMRALLAHAVPAAIARGDYFVHPRTGGGNAPKVVRGTPNPNTVVETKAMRPRRIYPRQGVYGAGFEVETYKPFQHT